MMCKWSSKSMAKPNEQSLWNDLNESYNLNIFIAYSARALVSCPSNNFCFEFLERNRMFY